MLMELIETSIFISLLRKFGKVYCSVERLLLEASKNSRTCCLTQELWDKIKVCFKYSSLEKIAEIEIKDIIVLNESKVVKWLINLYKKWSYKIIFYLKISRINYSVEQLKKKLHFLPVKTASIIIVTAILTNVIFSLLLRREISLLDWIIRGLLMFIGLAGLFCNSDYESIKETSWFMKYINTYCKF